MKTINFFRSLVFRILVLSVLAQAWSYATDYLQALGFFGDFQYQQYSWHNHLTWDWGWRHYVWTATGVVLVAVSIAKIAVWGDWYWSQIKRDDDVEHNAPENKLF